MAEPSTGQDGLGHFERPMISREQQRRLVAAYRPSRSGTSRQTAQVGGFNLSTLRRVQPIPLQECETAAACLMLDIAGFSQVADGWSAPTTREFLDNFYRVVFPIIDDSGGLIDRVAGDGVVAVYSPILRNIATVEQHEDAACNAAMRSMLALAQASVPVKAAITTGSLMFCATGVTSVFSEYTVIGPQLTELARLEEVATADEIVLRADTTLGRRVQASASANASGRFRFIVGAPQLLVLRGVNGAQPVPILRIHPVRPILGGTAPT